MRTARVVWGNDLRNIVRDRTVGVLLGVPLVFLVLLRLGWPVAEGQLAEAGDYQSVVLGVFCLIAGTFPAFMTAFIMLDERDEGVLTALRVLPLSFRRLLTYRLVVVAALSLLYPVALLLGTGLHEGGWARGAALALLCSAGSTTAALAVVSLARNKIEGLTLFKGLFFVYGLAGVAVAFPGGWAWTAAVFPPYWTFTVYEAATTGIFLARLAVAVAFHGLLMALAWRVVQKRLQ